MRGTIYAMVFLAILSTVSVYAIENPTIYDTDKAVYTLGEDVYLEFEPVQNITYTYKWEKTTGEEEIIMTRTSALSFASNEFNTQVFTVDSIATSKDYIFFSERH